MNCVYGAISVESSIMSLQPASPLTEKPSGDWFPDGTRGSHLPAQSIASHIPLRPQSPDSSSSNKNSMNGQLRSSLTDSMYTQVNSGLLLTCYRPVGP